MHNIILLDRFEWKIAIGMETGIVMNGPLYTISAYPVSIESFILWIASDWKSMSEHRKWLSILRIWFQFDFINWYFHKDNHTTTIFKIVRQTNTNIRSFEVIVKKANTLKLHVKWYLKIEIGSKINLFLFSISFVTFDSPYRH